MLPCVPWNDQSWHSGYTKQVVYPPYFCIIVWTISLNSKYPLHGLFLSKVSLILGITPLMKHLKQKAENE